MAFSPYFLTLESRAPALPRPCMIKLSMHMPVFYPKARMKELPFLFCNPVMTYWNSWNIVMNWMIIRDSTRKINQPNARTTSCYVDVPPFSSRYLRHRTRGVIWFLSIPSLSDTMLKTTLGVVVSNSHSEFVVQKSCCW